MALDFSGLKMMSGLLISDISAYRGERCLFEHLSLRLEAGEILQVLGPNGAGKSTLLKILVGLRSPDKGSVSWNSQTLYTVLEEYQSDLSYLGHRLGLKHSLSVLENLTLSAADPHEIPAIINRMGLKASQSLPIAALSRGQQQRTALARVLLARKKLWILDEPFAALDQAGFDLMQALIEQRRVSGGTIILSSHRALALNVGLKTLRLQGVEDV